MISKCSICLHSNVCSLKGDFQVYESLVYDKDREINKNKKFQVEAVCLEYRSNATMFRDMMQSGGIQPGAYDRKE